MKKSLWEALHSREYSWEVSSPRISAHRLPSCPPKMTSRQESSNHPGRPRVTCVRLLDEALICRLRAGQIFADSRLSSTLLDTPLTLFPGQEYLSLSASSPYSISNSYETSS